MDQEHAMRRGYLEEDFRLFHLKDAAMGPVDWHTTASTNSGIALRACILCH